LKTLSDTIRTAVTMDFLTGAVTRRQLEKALTQEWLRAQRTGAALALLLADIDGFTAYNAECGEEKGDDCLKSVADVLRLAAHRTTDVLGRWAGGQFALLLPETDARDAFTVAQRAIDGAFNLQMRHAASTGRDRRITLSVGGGCRDFSCSSSRNGSTDNSAQMALSGHVPNDLIMSAEQALENARSTGGHQARFLDVADLAEFASSGR
jgi:diguanylate cyclase (GGDEF)-like protein